VIVTRKRKGRRSVSPSFYVGAAILAALVGAAVTSSETARVAIAVTIAIPLSTLAARRPNAALYALVAWLAALGMVRRMLTGISSAYSLGDPLLLVGPTVMVALVLVACRRGAFRRRTPLTYAVLILTAALALSSFNPEQGSFEVGLGGALLVVVPMLAFLVGRALVSDLVLRRVLGLYAGLSLFAAAYGLVQTFSRLPSWDQRWVDATGYQALNVNGVIRAFGSFASGAEYAMFLVIGIVCWLTLGAASRWKALVVPAVALLGVAIWYESARGAVVLLVLALGAMAAARLRLRFGLGVVLGVVAVIAIPWAVEQLAPSRFGSDPGAQLAAHQTQGLTDPFGKGSTLPGHLELVSDGVRSIDRQPLGRGVGSVTVAAEKLGETGSGTESDLGNVARAAGVLGLGAYLVVLVLGIRSGYARALRRRDALALAVLGALFATLFQWLNGGQYAVAIVPWLLLGWLDKPPRTPRIDDETAPEPKPDALPVSREG
jgi:hypothetical protein